MAPLMRFCADDAQVPRSDLVATYYVQLACDPGTLLVSEATLIVSQGGGKAHAPGIL